MSREYQQYAETIVRRLKCEPPSEITRLPVAIPAPSGSRGATLLPVGWSDVNAEDSVALLAAWREGAATAFPAIFPVSLDGTRRWLIKQLLDTPDRLLFWVVSAEGHKIGHVGLFRFDYEGRNVELDNIVRGVQGAIPGVMEAAVRTLLDWTYEQFQVNNIFLRVFSDNARAIGLYERCGFRETTRVPLKRVEEAEVIRWVELDGSAGESVARYFVTMQLPRAVWQEKQRDLRQAA